MRRIPAGVVKKHLALALRLEKERMREQNKTFISRERKKELKEQVMLRLRSAFPAGAGRIQRALGHGQK